MALRTRLTDLLKIEHPIILAGMGGVSYAELCGAMCNAGGYGVLGMAGTSPRFIENQMQRVRDIKPVAEIVSDIMAGAEAAIARTAGLRTRLDA